MDYVRKVEKATSEDPQGAAWVPAGLSYDIVRHAQAIAAIAADTLARGWKPHESKPLTPVTRSWHPGDEHAGTAPARFSSRHPELWFAFTGVGARKKPRQRQPSRRYWRGRVESGLMVRPMRTTGHLEFSGIQALELDPAITALMEQPIVVRYQHEGRWRICTPDLYFEHEAGSGFIEFKHEQHASDPEEERLFASKGLALAAAGHSYLVLTERHFASQPLAANVELVLRLRHERADASQVRAVRDFLTTCGTAPVDEVAHTTGLSFGQVAFLLRHCVVGADLWNVPLNGTALLSLRKRGHERKADGRLRPPGLR